MTNIIEYSKPQSSVLSTPADRTLYMAGQGGGKTALMGAISVLFMLNVPNSIGLIAANTYNQLSDSTIKEILLQWERYGVTEYTTSNPGGKYVIGKQPPAHFKPHGYTFINNHNKMFCANGCVIMLASLENYKAIEGQNIGWALLDETADTREDALKTVITARLRQKGVFVNPVKDNIFPYSANGTVPVNPLYVFTKPGRVDWINNYFFLEEHKEDILSSIYSKTEYFDKVIDNRHVVIASTYHNENNLPNNYIKNRLLDLTEDEAARLVYGSPFAKSGNEYYQAFTSVKHVTNVTYKKGYPLHITFDFNVHPYMTAQIWQIIPGQIDEANCIDEFAMKAPRNTVEQTCQEILYNYEHLAGAGVFIYGDSSGHSSLPLKDARNFYDIIKAQLRNVISANSLRLLKQNPRHNSVGMGTIGRREFMNALLNDRYNVKVNIDSKCKYTIADFENLKEDPNGAKLKTKVEVDGIKCEKYGHMSDAADSVLCYLYGNYLKRK